MVKLSNFITTINLIGYKAFVMELVDILVLGTSALVRVGSNPTEGIEASLRRICEFLCKCFLLNLKQKWLNKSF